MLSNLICKMVAVVIGFHVEPLLDLSPAWGECWEKRGASCVKKGFDREMWFLQHRVECFVLVGALDLVCLHS
jgi:hypothetical protein